MIWKSVYTICIKRFTGQNKGKGINSRESSARCHNLQGKIHSPLLRRREFFALQWHPGDKGRNAVQTGEKRLPAFRLLKAAVPVLALDDEFGSSLFQQPPRHIVRGLQLSQYPLAVLRAHRWE